jgi:hypothetical protein
MAQPARTQERGGWAGGHEAPPIDPSAVKRAYRLERAKRHVRRQRLREKRLAHLRFWLVLVLLTSGLLFLGLTVWNEIERLFGL